MQLCLLVITHFVIITTVNKWENGIFVSLLRRQQSQCPHMAAVYCDKPNIAEREDAIESARVVVFMGCECKLKSGGREASEYDGTVYVDDVRAHASMRIGTIPHLPHRSNVVTSLSTSQENKFENILYEELPRPHRGPGKYFYNKIIAINIYAQISF